VKCYCDPKANGVRSDQIGWGPSARTEQVFRSRTKPNYAGVARCTDIARVPISKNSKDNSHPAAYPPALAEWIIKLLVPEGGTVLDPFCGSGTTGVAAEATGRRFIGIEREASYVALARARLQDAEVRAFA
jgi:DNA modification methylase